MSGSRTATRPLTLRDVARRAQVSPATVSRVINGYAHVRPHLRTRVLKAVSLLGYHPDQVARSLVKRETRTIGLIVADITNPFYAETARAIVEKLGDRGYHVILCNTDNRSAINEEYIGVLRQRRVDGMILGSVSLRDPVVEALVEAHYPCLMYNRRLRSGRGNYVVLDNLRGSYELTGHLIELGHRRIGFISGLPDMSVSADRLLGYKRALRDAGIAVEPRLIRPGAFRERLAQSAATELLKGRGRPTAIVAANDLMALGAIQAAEDLGLWVPQDLAVVGFDDIAVAGHRRVQLTTMAQPAGQIGRLVAEGIMEIIRDPRRFAREPLQQVLAPTLVIRRTCGALEPRSAGRGPNDGRAARTQAAAKGR
jgi:LacI family transcriptional regulator